jgi:ATP-dependent Clp protease ATP-binding subunit ClpC
MKSRAGRRSLQALGISPEFHPFICNLSEQARKKDRMPFIGRENEIEAVLETLLRKLKNDIILVGRPGVGKTALITELARRINGGRVPVSLRGKVILELALDSFSFSRKSNDLLARDFEKLFAEFGALGGRVILFLDELRMQPRAAGTKASRNEHLLGLLKTHLAAREPVIIAAATAEEYHQAIVHDPVFGANFSAIQLNEPGKKEMLAILGGVRGHFERYYGLKIPSALFERIYTCAQRFNPTRAFPDKAIELLDISCSKACLKKAITLADTFVFQSAAVLSRLPVGIVRLDPQVHYRHLLDYLKDVSVDQDKALEEIARIIKLSKLETTVRPMRPQGIFLFLGPTGTGKSFVAARIAEYLFGSVDKLRTIDLAGYGRAEDLDRLVGGRAGQHPGQLVQEVENHPFSVLFLENVNEAHAAILGFLGKTLTQGVIVDDLGKKHFLTSTIVILSLSAIGEKKRDATIGFVNGATRPGTLVIEPKIMNVLDWMDEIIQFTPLTAQHLRKIASLRLQELARQLRQSYGCRISVDPALLHTMGEAAVRSGRFAHAVSEYIERQIRLPLMDMITKTDRRLNLRVRVEKGRVRIESL